MTDNPEHDDAERVRAATTEVPDRDLAYAEHNVPVGPVVPGNR